MGVGRGLDVGRVRIVVTDDTRRSRLTVAFRLGLALPHLVWLALWSVLATVAAVVTWLAALVLGRPPRPLHAFLSRYVRYGLHVLAYLLLAADPFPGFTGAPGSYPVDAELPEAGPQPRLVTLLRIVLAVPALLLAAALTGFPTAVGRSGSHGGHVAFGGQLGLAPVAAFLGWFAALALGRMPVGLRDACVLALGYRTQVSAYLLMVTSRYPTSDPRAVPAEPAPPHPVALAYATDRRRSRISVLFRALLVLPHWVWLWLWSVIAWPLAVVAWLAALVLGRVPGALHRFLAAYVRYAARVVAFLYLVANPFPPFPGRSGDYAVDVEIAPPARQARWRTLLRAPLALPAALLAGALSGALVTAAVLAWFASLALRRIPAGLLRLEAYALRYTAQTSAYVLLLTDRYPYAGPGEPGPAVREPVVPAAPVATGAAEL